MRPLPHILLCNGAEPPNEVKSGLNGGVTRLEYDGVHGYDTNVNLRLPEFVQEVLFLPRRILDLLEIAGYVFAADRLITRGRKDAVEYLSWSRWLHFVMKVRDYEFWSNPETTNALCEALQFVSGDFRYEFTFIPSHRTPPTSLFDHANVTLPKKDLTTVVLFSGGLDSLAGAIEQLETSAAHVCLISHQSGQPGITRTQTRLFRALSARYPERATHFRFVCGLKGIRPPEESQRTRSFLYTAVGLALAVALRERRIFVFENGVTSLNFARRQDLINARASRTTHPKTLRMLETFYRLVVGEPFTIENPFSLSTKTDVLNKIIELGRKDLISSTVSCSTTFKRVRGTTHCGMCSQCIDRRFSVYCAEVEDIDNVGLYSFDFVIDKVGDPEAKITLIDYLRQARDFAIWSEDRFYLEKLNEISLIVEVNRSANEVELIGDLTRLCRRHGEQVLRAIKRMRDIHDNPFNKLQEGSLLHIVSEREYLKEPTKRLIQTICGRLQKGLPLAFQHDQPKNEAHLNDVLEALIKSREQEFMREHPAIAFGLAKVIPDHSLPKFDLLIEAKFLRKSTTPSKASEAMAADLTKLPEECHKLFVVYDPFRAISDDASFRQGFERKGRCTVLIVR